MNVPDLLKDVKDDVTCDEENAANHETGSSRSNRQRGDKQKSTRGHLIKERLIKALCCMGWVLFCPCWSLGVCLREHPESMEDLSDDPCWPCFYKSKSTDS